MAKNLQYPELEDGIRVQYKDRNEATRQGYIYTRHGNLITIISALKNKERVDVRNIIGYWQKRVKASPSNMVKLKK